MHGKQQDTYRFIYLFIYFIYLFNGKYPLCILHKVLHEIKQDKRMKE
jgi:hypothetical protein